jgi:two-component system CheB/CheR fusion protein
MPTKLISYASHPPDRLFRQSTSFLISKENIDEVLSKIFLLIRSQTGHDFSQYKPSTINRRIERRMAVNHIEELDNYLKYLLCTTTEIDALFYDILIGVTNFFRDTEAFKDLEKQIIPNLFVGRKPSSVIRVWSAGCSTGEEAYSLAILLAERMEALKQAYTVQIFATDIDSRAITIARIGVYPASIAADITPERLARFFTVEPDGISYRIHKVIRDMLVFSEQDLIKDPPFSKLDLISCRNVLIYFGAELQEKIVRLFHFALNPGGMLFLGTSEGGGDFKELFSVLDRKSKLYIRKDQFQGTRRIPLGSFLPQIAATKAGLPLIAGKRRFGEKLPLRELTEKALIEHIISAGVLVNAQGNIFYLHGHTGMYLEPSPGEAGVNNILKMAREGLRTNLSTALHKAVSTNETVKTMGLRVKTNGHFTMVNLFIHPVTKNVKEPPEFPLYLVILEEAPEAILPLESDAVKNFNTNADERIAALERELRAKDEYLQNTHEELESSTEELKSSNEEMQSVNEELQSTNEELETSKEELQSVNEELSTVNNELNSKVNDLYRLNNDMNNLLAGSGIATIFVDHKLKILRFTPNASLIINLIQTDIGRPVNHVLSNLCNYNNMEVDLHNILDTLATKEAQVQTKVGRWYSMRMMPYRTLENVIEGIVLSFIDITEMKRISDELALANKRSRLAGVVHDSLDAIIVHDLNGLITAWNPGAVRLYGLSEDEALKMNLKDLIPMQHRDQSLHKLFQMANSDILEIYQTERINKSGEIISVWITATSLFNKDGKNYAIATIERGTNFKN